MILVMFHHLVLWRHAAATCTIDRVYAYCTETGWVGVEIFFVLSGFLITGILLEAKGSPNYFRNFYARRSLRIFPLYYFVLFLLLVVFPHLKLASTDLSTVTPHAWSYWLFLSNFTLPLRSTVFSQSRVVTWSVAIEEQFYLVWPTVIWVCSRQKIVPIALSVIGVSILSRSLIAVFHVFPEVSYFWTFSHMDGLALGAVVAALWRSAAGRLWLRRNALRMGIIGFIGMVSVMVYSFSRHLSMRLDPTGQIPLYTFMAMLSASILIVAISEDGIVAAVLRNSWLRFFGKYSYGYYLFHTIVCALVASYLIAKVPPIGSSRLPAELVLVAVTVAISTVAVKISWILLERPFLRLKVFFASPQSHPVVVPAGEAMGKGRPRLF